MKIKETYAVAIKAFCVLLEKDKCTLTEIELLHYKLTLLYNELSKIYISIKSNLMLENLYNIEETEEELIEYIDKLAECCDELVKLAFPTTENSESNEDDIHN